MKESIEIKCPKCGDWTEGEQVENGKPEAPEYCLSCNEYLDPVKGKGATP